MESGDIYESPLKQLLFNTLVEAGRLDPKNVSYSTLQTILSGDILIIEADPEDLQELLSVTGFQIAGGDGSVTWSSNKGDLITSEAVIAPNSELEGRTPSGIDMLKRYGINLLAVSRQGEHIRERLSTLRLAIGDVLLVQGNPGSVREGLRSMGVLPLRPAALVAVFCINLAKWGNP